MAIKEIRREWSACQLGYVCEFMLHTEADVKDLPICCVGSVAHVSETNTDYVCNGKRWLPREGETVVILPETTVTPDEAGESAIMEPLLSPLVDGNEYTVTYNGAKYLCKAQNVGEFFVLGNVGADTGGVDTGEPFQFGALSLEAAAQMGFYAMLIAIDGAETVTISITAKTELVNESENAGGGGAGAGGVFPIVITPDVNSMEQMDETSMRFKATADKTLSECLEAFEAGYVLQCRESVVSGGDAGKTTIIPLTTYDGEHGLTFMLALGGMLFQIEIQETTVDMFLRQL